MPEETIPFTIDDAALTVRLQWPIPLEFEEQITRLISTHRAEKLILDFTEVSDINSMAIAALASLALVPELKPITIELINLQESILKTIKMVGIDKLFSIQSPRIPLHEEHITIQAARTALEELETLDEKNRETLRTFIDQAARNTIKLGQNERKIEHWEDSTKENAQEMAKMQQHLMHSERLISLGQLSAGVAHEFNNIIAGMRGYAQLAQMRNDENSIKQALEVVIDLSDRASKITEGLLSFSRKKNPVKKESSLKFVTEKVLTLIEKQCLLKNIIITKNWGDLDDIEFDPNQIEQVLLNIVTNAVHAMPDGGTIEITTDEAHQYQYIRIKDSGPGIPEKYVAKIFDPFFTTKGPLGGGDEEGTGLGLSISQGIIHSHKGRIEVVSNENGAEFTIFLPTHAKRVQPLPTPKPAAKVEEITLDASYDILVVDDEPHLCHIMSAFFKHRGHTVRVAQDGETAIRACEERKPDIMFLDILMPGLNGADTYVEIMRRHKDIATVVVTGHAGKELQMILDTMRRVGSVELVRKPFNFTTLQCAMKAALEKQG